MEHAQYRVDAALPAERTGFARWREEVSDAADRVAALAAHAAALGTEIFGSIPQPAGTEKDAAEPRCQSAALETAISRLAHNLSDLEDKIRRLDCLIN